MKQQNVTTFEWKENAKITKRSHAYKGYASTYSAEILIFQNPELLFKDTEYAIRNKLIELLTGIIELLSLKK